MNIGMERNRFNCYMEGWDAKKLWSSLGSCLYDIRSREVPKNKVQDEVMGVNGWIGMRNVLFADENVKVKILETQKSPRIAEEPSKKSRITNQMIFCFSKRMQRRWSNVSDWE